MKLINFYNEKRLATSEILQITQIKVIQLFLKQNFHRYLLRLNIDVLYLNSEKNWSS